MKAARVAVAMVLALMCAAPTAGDIGGCGAAPEEIGADRYARARKKLECDRCRECGVTTARCVRACQADKPSDVSLPPTCRPLLHDADVCMRALGALSCSAFGDAVDDANPQSPTECLFCREGVASSDVSTSFADAGAGAGADGADGS